MLSIQTARLRIRPFAEADLDAVALLLDGCFGRAPREAHRAWLEWAVRNYAALARLGQPPYGDYAVELRDGGAVVGSVGLVPSFGPFGTLPSLRARTGGGGPDDLHVPEMGLFWAVAPAHRRRGYAAEAAGAMAAFAFGTLRAARLVATTEHDNAASVAVMRRIGMTVETNPGPDPPWFQVVGVLFNRGGRESEDGR